MTELLYMEDSYIQTFEAVVSAIDNQNSAIILNRTAFYPGGGGQPADTGKIKSKNGIIQISRAKKIGAQVVHIANEKPDFPPIGEVVRGTIDWGRRYQLMRTHTAMHILCGVIFRDYGASVTGGDMQPLQGRMDFEFETMQKELVQSIEKAVNLEVEESRPLRTAILPREEAFQIPDLIRTKINLLPESIREVRVVEIVGLDLQADGGTHVMNTSEVGYVRIVDYKSKGRINKRIYIELSERSHGVS